MNKTMISNSDFIRAVAQETHFRQADVKDVMHGIEAAVTGLLDQASEDTSVDVKVLPHVSLVAKRVGSHEKRMPNGDIINTTPKLKVTARMAGALKDLDVD